MATGTIVAGTARKDAATAYAAVLVAEGGSRGNVEYNASTPLLKDDGTAKTLAELKADLAADVAAQRSAQVGVQTVAGVSGSVTV